MSATQDTSTSYAVSNSSGTAPPKLMAPANSADCHIHVQLHMEPEQIADNAVLLQRLPTIIVFDHMGKLTFPGGMLHPAYRVIRGLFDSGRAWVKLSGAYLDTSKALYGFPKRSGE